MDQLLCRVNQSRVRCDALLSASSKLMRRPLSELERLRDEQEGEQQSDKELVGR